MKTVKSQPLIFLCLIAMAALISACGGGAEDILMPGGIAAIKAGIKALPSEDQQAKVTQTVLEFEKATTLEPFFSGAYGCAIFPTIGKGGIGIGGAHGKGWVFKKGTPTGRSSMTQLTIGFQWGGQAYSQIIFFEDENAYNNFTSGNFEFGAQASAVAITAGASAQTSTGGGGSGSAGKSQSDAAYDGGMAIFTYAKGGLMYEATIGGQKFGYKPIEETKASEQ